MVSENGATQEPKIASLAREGSLCNLTLDEVQNQLGNLGKPLGSMNLDELLKSVWSVESGYDLISGLDFSGGANNKQQHGDLVSGSSLNPQGSLTLSGDLCKKTVDEVWKDLQMKKDGDRDREARERHLTLGEMTLEDFLVKAGVVTDAFHTKDIDIDGGAMSGIDSNAASQKNASQHGNWLQYQQQNLQDKMMVGFAAGNAIQQPFQVTMNPILDAAYSETMATLSDTQTLGRKRVASGNVVVEKTVERKQKRMIKNRESAARSRARKQAYTQELEIKVSRLEEENERLRRQCEMEKVFPCSPPPDPKHQLRRTGSATF